MQFTARIPDISAAAQNAAGGIPSNPAMPIRAGMHVSAEGDRVSLTGSDGDITFTATCPADITAAGQVVVPGKMLADILRGLPDGEASFTMSDAVLQIRYGKGMRSQFALSVIDTSYPGSMRPAEPCGTVPGEEFASAVRRTAFASQRSGADPVLTALVLHAGDQLEVVATDRYRLAHVACKWSPGSWDFPSALVPARAAERFCRGISGEVSIGWDEGTCTLRSGEFEMTTRLLAGDYPNWRKIAARDPGPDDVEIALDELAGAVRRVQLATGEERPAELTFSQGTLLVEASGQSGRACEVIDVPGYDDAQLCVLLAFPYLLDGLGACAGDCRIALTGELKPVYLYSGDDFRYMILPRRRT